MPRAMHPCSCTGCQAHLGQPCPEIVPNGTSRCDDCRRTADKRRGTAKQRGYTSKGHARFRRGVLARDPYCVCTDCGAHDGQCFKLSTVADHYPLSRRELVAAGMDPNDPAHGRGLCEPCHDKSTAQLQPGGWNAR